MHDRYTYMVQGPTPARMTRGTIKFFDSAKGYGFIETEGAGDDVFFHRDDVEGADPQEGQAIEFEVTQAARGPRAENIKLV